MKHTPITLFLDTSSREYNIVRIFAEGKLLSEEKQQTQRSSQVLLPLIQKTLQACNLSCSSLHNISVVTGPGSFTGLRVGIAVANTLGWFLNIPVNGKRQIVLPQYKTISAEKLLQTDPHR